MTCDVCKERPATVHFSQVVNGEFSESHMCESCAKERSMGGLLSSLVQAASTLGPGREEPAVKSPPCMCGMTLEEFRKTGFLGCPECYRTFKKHLAALLKRIHGSAQHTGSSPIKLAAKMIRAPVAAPKPPSPAMQAKQLKRELAKAVDEERFEEAARLRDQLKHLSEKSGKSLEGEERGEHHV